MKSISRVGGMLAVLIAMASLPACATSYSAKPMTAKVVDADTKEPLAEVHVIADWVLQEPNSGRRHGSLEIAEAVTDRLGRFSFAGWGTKMVPSDRAPGTRLTRQDPELLFFKTGYKTEIMFNDTHPTRLWDPSDKGPPVRHSQWDGKVIELKKFTKGLPEYQSMLSSFFSGTVFGDCAFKKFPRTLIALDAEADRLKREGIRNGIMTIERVESRYQGENCGSVREYLEAHRK